MGYVSAGNIEEIFRGIGEVVVERMESWNRVMSFMDLEFRTKIDPPPHQSCWYTAVARGTGIAAAFRLHAEGSLDPGLTAEATLADCNLKILLDQSHLIQYELDHKRRGIGNYPDQEIPVSERGEWPGVDLSAYPDIMKMNDHDETINGFKILERDLNKLTNRIIKTLQDATAEYANKNGLNPADEPMVEGVLVDRVRDNFFNGGPLDGEDLREMAEVTADDETAAMHHSRNPVEQIADMDQEDLDQYAVFCADDFEGIAGSVRDRIVEAVLKNPGVAAAVEAGYLEVRGPKAMEEESDDAEWPFRARVMSVIETDSGEIRRVQRIPMVVTMCDIDESDSEAEIPIVSVQNSVEVGWRDFDNEKVTEVDDNGDITDVYVPVHWTTVWNQRDMDMFTTDFIAGFRIENGEMDRIVHEAAAEAIANIMHDLSQMHELSARH